MKSKSLTYLFLIILLAGVGTVISEPASVELHSSKASRVFQIAGKSFLLDSQSLNSGKTEYKLRESIGYRSALKEENNSYRLINYLHSEIYFEDNNNSGRTSIWFTSRIKN